MENRYDVEGLDTPLYIFFIRFFSFHTLLY
nr:MAG TPA: hypothetical protein [Caudoviricetes sp.]